MYSTLDLMHVWINYIIEKSVIYASNDPQDDVNQFEQGGAFGQETATH